MKDHRSILLIPLVRRGNGTGHLRRCLEAADTFADNPSVHASLLIESKGPALSAVDAILRTYPRVTVTGSRSGADITVVDGRENTRAYVDELKQSTFVVGLDEGGSARGYCDYLIDTFPSFLSSKPNTRMLSIRAPKNRRKSDHTVIKSVLITFGGEDPAGLTPLVCDALTRGGFDPGQLTAVRGPSAPHWDLEEQIRLLDSPASLRELLAEYDVIITSFGLTAFEALSAGVPVVLVNPTRYHTRLSRSVDFPCAGTGSVNQSALLELLRDGQFLMEKMAFVLARLSELEWDVYGDGIADLAGKLESLPLDGLAACPVCGKKKAAAEQRYDEKTYYRCECTGIIFMRSFAVERTAYDASYFFSEYREQYGRTYLEDFQAITGLAAGRIDILSRFWKKKRILLDIGCAFGPFLAEASRRGYACYGTDISPDAIAYITEELKLPAAVAEFPDFTPETVFKRHQFEVVTMWYVIEHFEALGAVLTRVNQLTELGGVFAFSTPSSTGISGRRSLRRFLAASPADHFTVWSPRSARRVLRRFGFEVVHVRVTGHHPDRFPGVLAGSSTSRLIGGVSRLLRLGDTFEAYAVKVREV